MSRAIPVMTSNTQRIAGISMVSCGSGPTRPAPHRHLAMVVDMVVDVTKGMGDATVATGPIGLTGPTSDLSLAEPLAARFL